MILAARGPKNHVDPFRPYHMLVEPECSADGIVEDVATIFLSNRECPFRCLMCDLWKNTTNEKVPVGAISEQIRFALSSLPQASHVKLYNSGNFFDAQAIPREEFKSIASLVSGFQTVIVENHPKLCGASCVEFQQMCGTQLEVALGLETSHEPTLSLLNKQMTTRDFARACRFLVKNDMRVRAFILLRPPGTSEVEGVQRAIESIRFAFDCGVQCCAVIAVRAGNGMMEQLQANAVFTPPVLRSLETAVDETIMWKRGRVFADLWDVEQFSECGSCVRRRVERLQQMNLSQTIGPSVSCDDCSEFGAC